MKRTRRRGFTLIEVLTATAVSMMVLAGAVIVFVQVRAGWLRAATDLQLMGEGRLIRERMLRSLGAGGTFGLREAGLSSVTITNLDQYHSRVSFLDGQANNCIITESNFGGRVWNVMGGVGGQVQVLLPNAPYNTYADKLLVTTGTDRSLTINMRLGAVNQLGTTSFYSQIINVRLINP